MFRDLSFYFILMPFLLGFAPWVSMAAINTMWPGFIVFTAIWVVGPIAKGRRQFFLNPDYGPRAKFRVILIMVIAVLSGTALGSFVFQPQPVY